MNSNNLLKSFSSFVIKSLSHVHDRLLSAERFQFFVCCAGVFARSLFVPPGGLRFRRCKNERIPFLHYYYLFSTDFISSTQFRAFFTPPDYRLSAYASRSSRLTVRRREIVLLSPC